MIRADPRDPREGMVERDARRKTSCSDIAVRMPRIRLRQAFGGHGKGTNPWPWFDIRAICVIRGQNLLE
jgi:hypothetical protein